MLAKIALISISYLALMGLTNKTNSQVTPYSSNYHSTNNIELKEINKTKSISFANYSESGNYMTLTSTRERNKVGNPLYTLSLYINGQKIKDYRTVTGRAHTQNRNKHIAGTEAPLPEGRYSISSSVISGTHPEVGSRFLPIYPQFQTGRSALGIHYDPSFEKNNGEDGTAGCVALTNREDLNELLTFVDTHQPKHLQVNF